MCIIGTIKQILNPITAAELINQIMNVVDYEGMRPLDLLALKIDEDHKNFIKEFHGEEKNFKI